MRVLNDVQRELQKLLGSSESKNVLTEKQNGSSDNLLIVSEAIGATPIGTFKFSGWLTIRELTAMHRTCQALEIKISDASFVGQKI